MLIISDVTRGIFICFHYLKMGDQGSYKFEKYCCTKELIEVGRPHFSFLETCTFRR